MKHINNIEKIITQKDGNIYRINVIKSNDFCVYNNEMFVGKKFKIYTDKDVVSNGMYMNVFLQKGETLEGFNAEANFNKMIDLQKERMLNNNYNEYGLTFDFKDNRTLYLLFKDVETDFYMYIKASD